MKRLFLSLFLIPFCLISAEEFTVVNLRDVQDLNFFLHIDDKEGDEVEPSPENTILEISKGTHLPVDVILKGDFFHMSGVPGPAVTVEITKTFYLRTNENTLLLSHDKEKWSSFEEFFTGELFFGIEAHDGEATLNFGLEANERK